MSHVTIIMICVWLAICRYFRQVRVYSSRWKHIIVMMPILLILLNSAIETDIKSTLTENEIASKRTKFSHLIPTIVFSVALLISHASKDLSGSTINIALPYLLGALILGTVIPCLIEHLNFEKYTEVYSVMGEVLLGCQSMSFALLLAGTGFPLLQLYDNIFKVHL